jgi:ribosome-binding factor A
MKNKSSHNIDQSIIDKKNEVGKRRVLQVASTLKKIALEIINGEFAETCSEFSVIDASMSPDLRYFDIYVYFYSLDFKEDKEDFLKMLNYEDLSQKQKMQSKFFKINLNYRIAQHIIQRARLRCMPIIRFKHASNEMMFFMENSELQEYHL